MVERKKGLQVDPSGSKQEAEKIVMIDYPRQLLISTSRPEEIERLEFPPTSSDTSDVVL